MKANSSETAEQIMERVPQVDILKHYFNIYSLPALINSPLRRDKNPSFYLYTPDGEEVRFIDYATGDKGDIILLMQNYFRLSFSGVIRKIGSEKAFFSSFSGAGKHKYQSRTTKRICSMSTELRVKVREWREYDVLYWESYGIGLKWLKYAEVYPISNMIMYKDGTRSVFASAKFSYAFVERKDGKVSIKVYQPCVKDRRRKWFNGNDVSVVGLWTKVPQTGNRIVICSSLKDALCLWANAGIPAIYVQSETAYISKTAQEDLKRRFKKVFICFDNDPPGIMDGKRLSENTGFQNVVLPSFDGGKDISDFYKVYGRDRFIETIKPLFK